MTRDTCDVSDMRPKCGSPAARGGHEGIENPISTGVSAVVTIHCKKRLLIANRGYTMCGLGLTRLTLLRSIEAETLLEDVNLFWKTVQPLHLLSIDKFAMKHVSIECSRLTA